MIEIKEGMYILAMVNVFLPEKGRVKDEDTGRRVKYDGIDFMGMVYRDIGQEEGAWTLQYRFRYHVDTKVFGSSDIRHWSGMHTDPGAMSEQEAEDSLRTAAQVLASQVGVDYEWIPIHGGPEEFHAAMESGKYQSAYAGKAQEGITDASEITPEMLDGMERDRLAKQGELGDDVPARKAKHRSN